VEQVEENKQYSTCHEQGGENGSASRLDRLHESGIAGQRPG